MKPFPEGGKHMPPDKAAHKIGQKWSGLKRPKKSTPKHKKGKKT